MPSPPPDDKSSSTAADKAISSLRARLRSEDLPPSPSLPHPKTNIYEKLQTAFKAIAQTRNPSTTALTETFAHHGQHLHTTSLQSLHTVHETASAKITSFHSHASHASTTITALYNNISYPLSATLCHAKNLPRASIARHIRSLSKKISAAEAQLSLLRDEWSRCLDEEALLLREEEPVEEDVDCEAGRKGDELKAMVDDIVRTRGVVLDALDQEYRDLLWAESNRMMQAMMAD